MADYSWILKIKNRLTDLAKTKKALGMMLLICFLEPIILPMIPELIIAPILLSRRNQAWGIIFLALFANIIGATLIYFATFFAGKFLLLYGGDFLLALYDQGRIYLKSYGFFLPFIGSLTPFPLKVITWTCGLTHFHFFSYIVGIFLGRLLRYGAILVFSSEKPYSYYFFSKIPPGTKPNLN